MVSTTPAYNTGNRGLWTETLILFVREESDILFFIIYSDINIGSLLTVGEINLFSSKMQGVPRMLFVWHILHTLKWMHFITILAKQQHDMVFAAFLITLSHSSLCLCELGPTASVKSYCVVGTHPSYLFSIFNLWQHHT